MFADPTAHGLSTSTELLTGHVSVDMRAQAVAATQEEERVERGSERRESTYVRCTQLRTVCAGTQSTNPRDSRGVPKEI